MDDIARIKAVCPDMIHWAYVRTSQLRPDTPNKRAKRDDLFLLDQPEAEEYTLVFEFTDHALSTGKATSKRVVGRGSKAQRRGQSRQETAVDVVARRTRTFERALDELIAACALRDEDPEALLTEASAAVRPIRPDCAGAGRALPSQRPSIQTLLQEMQDMPWWRDQIVPGGRRTFPARIAVAGEVDPPLSDATTEALQRAYGITQLYSHQAAAISYFRQGKHVVASTGTSSGKSLIYQIPIATTLSSDPQSTALCIFPTKALTQDQIRSLRSFLQWHEGTDGVHVDVYDGDTEVGDRAVIRERVRVLFTNPDMLHQAILPHEARWRTFFRGLRVVVLDELHVYHGIFGTHVGYVLRRLRRLCAALGNDNIQFVSSSATIAHPASHMSALLGLDATSIAVADGDGSPSGEKQWLVWNPPWIDEKETKHGRVSSYSEVSCLFRFLIQRGIRTIIFSKVRRTCEIVVRQIREDLVREGQTALVDRVFGYRSGYSAADRRRLEHEMASGHLLGLVATSALELGVDIGVLDAVILFGVPYSLASLWQQAGRAGRRRKDALVVVLAEPFSVDQYYMRHPELLLAPPHTELPLDMDNEFVLEGHLRCAAFEVPVSASDARYFGPRCLEVGERLLERDREGYFHCTDLHESPAREISIRGARQDTYQYIDAASHALLEEVELERVYFEAFEGAVFLHQGTSYICKSVHHDARVALMVRAQVLYHTRPREMTNINARETWRLRSLRHAEALAYYGKVEVERSVWGYYKVDRRANILDTVDIESAPLVRSTTGVWMDVPWTLVEQLSAHGLNAAAAIHSAEHAVLSLTPLFVVSASDDVRTDCKVAQREFGRKVTKRKRPSRMIFYDKPGHHAGTCAQVFVHMDALLCIALQVIESCGCTDGCPGCIETPACLHDNEVSSKLGAMVVLRGLLQRPLVEPFEEPRFERGHAPTADAGHDVYAHTLCAPEEVPMRAEASVEHFAEDYPAPVMRATALAGPGSMQPEWLHGAERRHHRPST